MNSVEARPLNQNERDVLNVVLGAASPEAAALRAQIEVARVTGRWGGSPSVDLEVPETFAPAQVASGVLPVDAEVVDESGEPVGEILVWVEEGRLSAIEYAWYTDKAPASLPDADRITARPKS